jgi:cell wall-associated NlpC family hydrolase
LRFFALDAEERYRVSDRGPHGFWRPGTPHKWWSTTIGLSFALGGTRRHVAAASPRADPVRVPLVTAGRAGDVVQTALEVIGSPYQWGGTAENGFDCSGLIQYAYGRHGIRLPRMSRDQAQAGSAIPTDLDSLRPGDILAFSAQPGGGVTHVGLYIGEGKFIHSSSTGVRLSRLVRDDPDGKYWIPRWVGARRLLS